MPLMQVDRVVGGIFVAVTADDVSVVESLDVSVNHDRCCCIRTLFCNVPYHILQLYVYLKVDVDTLSADNAYSKTLSISLQESLTQSPPLTCAACLPNR